MDESRRDFLKKAGCAAVGAGVAFPLLRAVAGAMEGGHGSAAKGTKQLAIVVDIKKCMDEKVREACTNVCHTIHNVPDVRDKDGKIDPKREVKWLWTEKHKAAFPEQTHGHSAVKDDPVLVLCNHCGSPPCVRVCPTQATWKRKSDGVVSMDMHRCIGCRYCIAACPYGARSFNWSDPRKILETDANRKVVPPYPTRSKGVVEKCNLCSERLREGKIPACVEAAQELAKQDPSLEGAMAFGDVNDEKSEIAALLKKKNSIVRKPGLGTLPNVYYIV